MTAPLINTPGTSPIAKVASIKAEIEAWARSELGIVMSHFYGSTTWPDHSNRRCLDAMIAGPKGQQPTWASSGKPLSASECHTFGEKLYAYVKANAKRWGANGVIWDRTVTGFPHVSSPPYRGPYGVKRAYSGPSPHTDHNHIEVDGTAYVPPAKPVPVVWDGKSFPGASAFYVGAKGAYVTLLGERLVAHGWTGYAVGPGPEFSSTDEAGVRWFQEQQGWTGTDADGIPGPETWKRLMAAPAKPSPSKTPAQEDTVKSPSWSLLLNLDPPGGGAWQGASQDPSNGDWYVAHSRGSYLGDKRVEEVLLYRFDKTGKYLDRMVLVDAGHVYGFGVVSRGKLWLTWDDPDGNDVVELTYKAGATARKSAAKKLHVFTEQSVQASLSPTRRAVVLMEADGNRYLFTKRMVRDIRANRDKVSGRVVAVTKTSDWLQGFALVGDNLYVGTGKTDGRSLIKRYDLKTGRQTGVVDVTASGLLPGEKADGAALELEGMDAVPGGIIFTRKAFKGADRRLRVYKISNF